VAITKPRRVRSRAARTSDAAARAKGPAKGAAALRAKVRFRAKVRMYRQGLGDCFLVTLPRKTAVGGRSFYSIMIDCGVILGTDGAEDKMTRVVEDIALATNGHVDLLLATHAHWDHLSGFVQAADVFKKRMKIDEVWMPWTEDPDDPNGRKLRDDRDRAVSALRMSLAQVNLAGDTEAASELSGLLEFFGIGAATASGLDAARGLGRVRYCRPTDPPVEEATTGVRFYVMGPPRDDNFLKRTNPSVRNPETYGLAVDLLTMNAAAVRAGGTTDSPFSTLFAIPMPAAQAMEFFRKRYWRADGRDQWRNIETAAFADACELALQLDKVTNNTSLVLAIEVPDGDVLLFPADAQVGNWQSWGTLKWAVGNNEVEGKDLLNRTILYKVGHHGSHNATLQANGLELMKKLEVALIPVDEATARKKGWSQMPFPRLVDALESHARLVIRSDKPPPATRKVHADPNNLFYEVTL